MKPVLNCLYRFIGRTALLPPENYANACSLRVSGALNYSGNPIPVFFNNLGEQRTQKGADNLN